MINLYVASAIFVLCYIVVVCLFLKYGLCPELKRERQKLMNEAANYIEKEIKC